MKQSGIWIKRFNNKTEHNNNVYFIKHISELKLSFTLFINTHQQTLTTTG